MKALIIYASVHHGNTARIPKVTANVLNADLLQLKQVTMSILER